MAMAVTQLAAAAAALAWMFTEWISHNKPSVLGIASGAIEGNVGQIWLQLYAIAATIVYCGVVSFVLLKIIGAVIPLRVSEEEEREGLDIRLHGESVV